MHDFSQDHRGHPNCHRYGHHQNTPAQSGPHVQPFDGLKDTVDQSEQSDPDRVRTASWFLQFLEKDLLPLEHAPAFAMPTHTKQCERQAQNYLPARESVAHLIAVKSSARHVEQLKAYRLVEPDSKLDLPDFEGVLPGRLLAYSHSPSFLLQK